MVADDAHWLLRLQSPSTWTWSSYPYGQRHERNRAPQGLPLLLLLAAEGAAEVWMFDFEKWIVVVEAAEAEWNTEDSKVQVVWVEEAVAAHSFDSQSLWADQSVELVNKDLLESHDRVLKERLLLLLLLDAIVEEAEAEHETEEQVVIVISIAHEISGQCFHENYSDAELAAADRNKETAAAAAVDDAADDGFRDDMDDSLDNAEEAAAATHVYETDSEAEAAEEEVEA